MESCFFFNCHKIGITTVILRGVFAGSIFWGVRCHLMHLSLPNVTKYGTHNLPEKKWSLMVLCSRPMVYPEADSERIQNHVCSSMFRSPTRIYFPSLFQCAWITDWIQMKAIVVDSIGDQSSVN